MKKIVLSLIITLAMVSCYDDYIQDFEFNSVYFPFQTNVRTLVVGEGMEIKIGACLSGVMENNKDRIVNFQIDNSLLTTEVLTAMKSGEAYIKNAMQPVTQLLPIPGNYYTLSDNSKMIIKKGFHTGSITLKADSINFLNDSDAINPTYALAFRITNADADSVLETKKTAVIAVKYENKLFGNYWHGGVTVVKDPDGATLETIKYYTTIPGPENRIWQLKTVSPDSLVSNGYSDKISSKSELTLTLHGDNIIINSAASSTFTFIPEGTSSFNQAKLLQDRKIFLSYKYINAAGNTCYAQDTLTFRNRIRDGVNEWQDENPSR